MQSFTRSLSLTAALLVATVVCLLIGAAPQQGTTPLARTTGATTIEAGPAFKTNAPAVPPITFADPDGQELILEDLSARTAIHGMLSLTELELRFRNPQSRRIEGRFTCTLPPNAAISRFAKEVNGQLMEGEVVERLRANQVYEQFLHQMRDPALLEQDQGNRFSARIFPIEANTTVRLLVSYTALLPLRDGVRTYTMPLRGMAKVGKLTFRAYVTPIPGEVADGKLTTSTAEVTSFDQHDWTPDRDIVLTWKSDRREPVILRAGDFYLAALRPNPVNASRQGPASNWLFYVDTSASSAEGAPHRIAALQSLLGALPADDRVQFVAFDQDVVPLASGSAAELSRSAGDLLRTRLFLGGTDLTGMLRDVTARLQQDPSRTVVIASDLVATLGSATAHDLQDAVTRLPRDARVHALILGSREDAPSAKAITAGHGRIVRVPFTDTLALRAAEAAAELRRPLGGTVDVVDAGGEWLYPTHFDDVAPGDEVLVLGKVKAGEEPRIASAAATRLEAATFGPLLEREAYRAYLEYLAQREANEPSEAVRRALATEQVKVSVEQRVVTPRTTMLVLETEWDYQRFGLDRRALAQILTIDAGGIGRLDRTRRQVIAEVVPPPPPPPPPPTDRRRRNTPPSAKAAPRPVSPPADALAVPPPQESLNSFGALRDDAPARAGDFAQNAPEADAEEGVEGGVAGGVMGGVAGGVVGGVPGGVVSGAASGSVAESITVAAEAPAVTSGGSGTPATTRRVLSPPVPRPVTAAVPPKREEATWVHREIPPRSRIDELEAKLRDDPRDRELYNQLGETLAALGEWTALRRLTLRWQPYDPENPQVYELLGIADGELGNDTEAARAFASLIEIAPAKTELLQRAGLLLLRAHRARLAEGPLRRALEARPDRVNSYRHLALMLWLDGRPEEAARVLESATHQQFPGWYGNAQRVIREELGYVYRAWEKKEPARANEIAQRARENDVDLDRTDALRVTLAWETDANDVDLHVVDPDGEECFYGHKENASGLALYEDITQGLGPEVIRTRKLDRGTYHVGVRYFAAGPMGISRGLVVIIRDGDQVQIEPFRLAQGGGDIRYVTGVRVK